MGSIMELSFIAKSEVNEMPGANLLSRLQRTIYVVRNEKRKAGQQAQEITQRMLEGDAVVLFGEGGDMTLGSHAVNIIMQGAWDVEVIFGDPIVFDEQSNRRHVTKEIQSQVRNNFLNTLHVRKNDIIKAD